MFLRNFLEESQQWLKMARGIKKRQTKKFLPHDRRLWEETIMYYQRVTLF